MSVKINELLRKIPCIEMEKIDTHQCRFMGKVDTYNITYKDKDFSYPKSILHKPYGGAEILPIDKQGDVYLEFQYRFPIRETILELPAGRLDEGENFLDCAKRELREETGCISEQIIQQGMIYAQPEFSDEVLGAFIALDCKQTESQDLDEDETVKVIKIPFESAVDLVKRNIITDERTIIGIGYAGCIQGLRFYDANTDKDKYADEIKKQITVEGEKLIEEDVDIDYTAPCEFGLVQDHIVKVPGDKNSRRECLYVKSGDCVLPISKNGKLGVIVRYMPTVEKNLVQLPSKIEFKADISFEDFGEMVTAVGYSNDRVKMYLANNLDENDEFIWNTKEETLEMIEKGIIEDGRAIAVILKYLL